MKIIITLFFSLTFFFNLNAQCTFPAGDNDGDGIADAIDTDDDNDGIPDLVENGQGSISWTTTQLNNFRTTSFSAPMACGTTVGFQCNPLITQLTAFTSAPANVNTIYQTMLRADINNATAILPYTMQFTANSTAANTAYGNITISLTPGTLYDFNIYFGDPELTSIKVTALNASSQLLSTSDWCTATYKSDGSSPSTTLGPVTKSATDITCTAVVASHNYDAWRIRFGETTLSQATQIVIEMNRFNASSGTGDGLFFFVSGTCRPDTDSDGTANDKDNDSDADGCPDALEGGSNFKYPDLDANGRLNVVVDANGQPVISGVPQTMGTSANAALFDAQSACAYPQTYPVSINQPGMPAYLNLGSTPLQGSDEADQPTQGSWDGKKLSITSLPTNGFDLIYNGTTVTQNQIISPYAANLLSIQPGALTPQGTTSTTFQYNTIDIADQQDQTSAVYTITWAQALLPLHLVNFYVYFDDQCQLKFSWTSADEINFSGYTIEKSRDGKTFTAITYVPGKGKDKNEYFFVINGSIAENYFRLRMQDIDGTVSYSKTMFVTSRCNSKKEIQIFPVPAFSSVTISGVDIGDRIKIYNMTGDSMFSEINTTANKKTINIQSLPAGIYTVRIIARNGTGKTIKLVKQ
jgi:hypothetical protein